jgi:hypothetical protein
MQPLRQEEAPVPGAGRLERRLQRPQTGPRRHAGAPLGASGRPGHGARLGVDVVRRVRRQPTFSSPSTHTGPGRIPGRRRRSSTARRRALSLSARGSPTTTSATWTTPWPPVGSCTPCRRCSTRAARPPATTGRSWSPPA